MRADVLAQLQRLNKDRNLLNKSELSRRLQCSRNTIDKYLRSDKIERKARKVKSKLEEYKSIINEKIDSYGATAMAIYKFIEKKGYMGKYGTVNNYVKSYKKNEKQKATIRFETTPGLQAQVDWKEKKTMVNKFGEIFVVNIFLIVLGYSRYKFIKLTSDSVQKTLFNCLSEAFTYYKGVSKEILFDNMSTVVDRKKSSFNKIAINEKFEYFAKDSGFKVITCRPYRPQTKGKVESLAKFTNRLDVYNGEFETFQELDEIVKKLNEEINNEVSQAINEKPSNRFKEEEKYLNILPPIEILHSYYKGEKEYKVSKESMITYQGKKYSVPTYYINKKVTVKELNDEIEIYYLKARITSFIKSKTFLNYKKDHYKEILKSDALKDYSDDEIDEYVEKNLESMDLFLK